MKKQVFFIHGGDAFSKYEDFLHHLQTVPLRQLPGAEPSAHWTKTLPEDLGNDFEVFMPSMPNKQNAQYEEWALWFLRHLPLLRDGVVLVGWSLGGMFLAKYLSENSLPIVPGGLFLLAAPCGTYVDGSGNDCGTFQFDPQVLQRMATKVAICEIWHSEDDFVVPYEHANLYAEAISTATLKTFSDKNHFLLAEFPELIAAIKNV